MAKGTQQGSKKKAKSSLVFSTARVRRKLRKIWSKDARSSPEAFVAAAAVVESITRMLFREAGAHVKPSKKEEEGPLLKPIHFAKALADKKSVLYGILPKRVAGVHISK